MAYYIGLDVERHTRTRILRTYIVGILITLYLVVPTSEAALEVMEDECSDDVAFPKKYNDVPGSQGTVIVRRGPAGWSYWSQLITVQSSSNGYIRWWCDSTKGNGPFDKEWKGWTAERSRCKNRSGRIKAKLSTNGLLQIKCFHP